MNRDYLIRTTSVCSVETPIAPDNKKFVNKRLNVDQFGTSKHLLNPCGFPMNDIMAFEEVQSDAVARQILQRIPVLKDSGITEDARTIDEHFEDLCPRDWSSPAEYVRYQKKVAENYYSRIAKKAEAARKKAESEKKIEFNIDDV